MEPPAPAEVTPEAPAADVPPVLNQEAEAVFLDLGTSLWIAGDSQESSGNTVHISSLGVKRLNLVFVGMFAVPTGPSCIGRFMMVA